MNNGLALALIAAIGFFAWPIVGRANGVNSFWTVLIVTVPTVVITSMVRLSEGGTFPSTKASLFLLMAGAMNGIGMLAATRIMQDSRFDLSALFPIINISAIAISALGGLILLGESFTLAKGIGLAFACVAAWLLSR
ncbi:hypothetical protein HZA85_00910 [Candidatus Uhrbacteria bacterium]|nr:hypothetical protein [Candidatus Uhrbacteria bacterium]